MLYVFLVDTGSFLTFDMNLALETVANFKEVLYKASKIAPDKQVLLISGGQSLDSSHRICSYSAGTDTNPIFLFSKATIENSVPPSPSIDFGSAQDLRAKIEACLVDKETTYQTVATRATLAQQLHENAREITRICEQLVHDQHMQQQGWSAVIANLEDIVTSFKGRADLFEQTYNQYLRNRDENLEILNQFNEDLNTLADIPVLPALLANKKQEISLLDWINLNDDEHTNLNMVADHCSKALDQMDDQLLATLQKLIETTVCSAERPEMKEIGGLGDRLYGLEQLLVEARKKVQEQGELAQAILQNQQRARNLNDSSILPDLCVSHRQQLKVMLKNDEKLRDIRSRCSRAKEELSANLHARLRWVMFVNRQLADVDSRMLLQHENLRRLRCQFDLLRQLHQAPSVYLRSMIEVVRRRIFAAKFLEWAKLLSSHSAIVYDNEVSLRKSFTEFCEGHFLKILFPGIMDQTLPSFATSPPPSFDCELPAVTCDDLELLKNLLPSLWARLQLPSSLKDVLKEPPTLLWLSSSVQKLMPIAPLSLDTGVLPSLSDALLSPPMRQSRPRSKRSLSEFNNREAEDCMNKHGGEDDEKSKEAVEETMKKQRCQLLALQSHLQCVIEGAQTALPALRNDLEDIRKEVLKQRDAALGRLRDVRYELAESIHIVFDSEQRDWQSHLDSVKQKTIEVEKERDKLTAEIDALRCDLAEQRSSWQAEKQQLIRNAQLQIQQREKELDRQRQEDLRNQTMEHQEEIEALKKQMKLLEDEHYAIVSKWRSAAEQETPEGLKAWRQEVLLDHEVELDQLKTEKETEISALLQEKHKNDTDVTDWREKYDALVTQCESEKLLLQEELQRKHRLEIEGLRSRFRMMASTTQRDRSPSDSSLDKYEIPTSPVANRHHITSISQVGPLNMGTSVAVLQSSDDKSSPSTPPSKNSSKKKPMSKMTRSLVRQGSANVYNCEVGDAVVVQWDDRYSTFILYNKGPYLHFLHADSIASLGLQGAVEPFLSRVTQREFCLVRKEENRYNLPKGTNFYRVKVERLSVNK